MMSDKDESKVSPSLVNILHEIEANGDLSSGSRYSSFRS